MNKIGATSSAAPSADYAANSSRITPQCIAELLVVGADAADEDLGTLELFYRSSRQGLCLLDREPRYIRLNERLATMDGVPLEARIGRTVREVDDAFSIKRPNGSLWAAGCRK